MLTLVIDPGGEIRALYSDALPEVFPEARLEIRRASTVEFNAARQLWTAVTAMGNGVAEPGLEIAASRSRSDCIAREVEYFNARL